MLESWSSTASSACGVDWGVISTPLQSNKITDSLAGCTIVVTGVSADVSRKDTEAFVKKYGGKLTKSISKRTSFVVLGNEPGPKKLEKIEELGRRLTWKLFLSVLVVVVAARSELWLVGTLDLKSGRRREGFDRYDKSISGIFLEGFLLCNLRPFKPFL